MKRTANRYHISKALINMNQDHKDEHKNLVLMKTEAEKMLDKALLTVDTGAIVVSFTYILQSGEFHFGWTLKLVILAWVTFGVSIVIGLFGHNKSSRMLHDLTTISCLKYRINSDQITHDEMNEYEKLDKKTDKDDKILRLFNQLQLWLSTIGILLLTCFVCVTIILKDRDTNQPKKTKTMEVHMIKKNKKVIKDSAPCRKGGVVYRKEKAQSDSAITKPSTPVPVSPPKPKKDRR